MSPSALWRLIGAGALAFVLIVGGVKLYQYDATRHGRLEAERKQAAHERDSLGVVVAGQAARNVVLEHRLAVDSIRATRSAHVADAAAKQPHDSVAVVTVDPVQPGDSLETVHIGNVLARAPPLVVATLQVAISERDRWRRDWGLEHEARLTVERERDDLRGLRDGLKGQIVTMGQQYNKALLERKLAVEAATCRWGPLPCPSRTVLFIGTLVVETVAVVALKH